MSKINIITQQEFLKKLAKLCFESGYQLSSCGCCDGIWVEDLDDSDVMTFRNELDEPEYFYDIDFGHRVNLDGHEINFIGKED